jgi:hypothetical protein
MSVLPFNTVLHEFCQVAFLSRTLFSISLFGESSSEKTKSNPLGIATWQPRPWKQFATPFLWGYAIVPDFQVELRKAIEEGRKQGLKQLKNLVQ